MFTKSTQKFVRQIQGWNGSLIPNTDYNDSGRLMDSTRLVIKTNPRWSFQQPSYRVYDDKLEDLFGRSTDPEWFQTSDFMEDYNHSNETKVEGKVGGDVADAGGNLTGRVYTKQKTKFGQLKKHEVDIVKVKRSFKNADAQKKPVLKKRERLVLVKERIFTADSCTLEGADEVDAGLSVKGMIQWFKLLIDGARSSSDKLSFKITPNTVIAYSVAELRALNTLDNMEDLAADGLSDHFKLLSDGSTSQDEIWKALWEFEEDLQSLADLPQETKSSLFLQLRKVLKDRTDLQNLLEDTDGTNESGVHLLVSALEELPDVALDMLTRCSPECLQGLSTLVTRRKTKKPVSLESLPGPLQDGGEFNWAAQFLCSSETLPDLDTLWEETGIHPGVLLLVLSIAIQGLAAVGGRA